MDLNGLKRWRAAGVSEASWHPDGSIASVKFGPLPTANRADTADLSSRKRSREPQLPGWIDPPPPPKSDLDQLETETPEKTH